ncbi:MAG: phosphate ABC transporter substrate-binding protein [Candidatus Eremiobacteraeota bacterium]|nr:phosphate ABC transporter substrate-binding protein [Candidatus Eremiobacteraeota bacterium]
MSRFRAIAALAAGALVLAPQVAYADTTITAAGSTALLPLVKSAAELYQNAHSDIHITVTGGGSNVGIAQVAARAVDLGDSDVIARNQPELVDHKVCVAGFSVLTHPGVGVKNLGKKQLQDIFAGKVTNWKQLGGADTKIVIINRPRTSGTRGVFVHTIMGGQALNESGLTEDATGTVIAAVKSTPGAISYAVFAGTKTSKDGHSSTLEGIAELSIDGVAPTEENVTTGKYPIWSYEHIYTHGPPNKDVSRFIAFIQSNSKLVHQLGYILTRDMKVTETDR